MRLLPGSGAVLAAPLLFIPGRATPLPQGGYTTEKVPDLGLTFQRARNYEAIPVQPDEEYVVLIFDERVPDDPRGRRGSRPELRFVWIEHAPDPPQAKAAPAGKRLDSLERFLEDRIDGYVLSPPVAGRERDGYKGREHDLSVKEKGVVEPIGWVYAYAGEQRTIALIGLCDPKDRKDQVRIWRQTAESLRIQEPEGQDSGKLERMYASLKVPNVPYRIAVRRKMVRGWKAEDTEHYIVIFSTTDQPLVRKILRDLELLWGEYARLFPPSRRIEAVSTVRICKSEDEYLSYGGPDGSAGYWNADAEELVLYDAERRDRKGGVTDVDTFIALYHEAFHQYIHYSAGEVAPHSWFNEGHGDFFSGATIRDGKVRAIGVNTWRVELIQEVVELGEHVPWGEIILFEQEQYYEEKRVGICYAQGWSMVYFLRKSKEVEKRPAWARILPTYFEALKEAYSKGMSELEAAGKAGDPEHKAKVALDSRLAASKAAFADVDLDPLERAWMDFVRKLERPK